LPTLQSLVVHAFTRRTALGLWGDLGIIFSLHRDPTEGIIHTHVPFTPHQVNAFFKRGELDQKPLSNPRPEMSTFLELGRILPPVQK
jgi:hypothetical protein